MLYTFSQGDYPQPELQSYLAQISPNDALLLWQNGVLLAIKYPELLADKTCYLLENDVKARNLDRLLNGTNSRCITINELVALTEHYFPQFAL